MTELAVAQTARRAVPAAGWVVIAKPGADEPYSRSVPQSWSPGSAGLASVSTPVSPVDDTPGSAPIVTVIAQGTAVVLTGFESTPWIWIVGAALIPVLWIIMWVRRDRISLHEWGYLRRAHWAWTLLGAHGYITARTIVVRRQSAKAEHPRCVC